MGVIGCRFPNRPPLTVLPYTNKEQPRAKPEAQGYTVYLWSHLRKKSAAPSQRDKQYSECENVCCYVASANAAMPLFADKTSLRTSVMFPHRHLRIRKVKATSPFSFENKIDWWFYDDIESESPSSFYEKKQNRQTCVAFTVTLQW